jgi:hypothetical protein
MFCDTQIAELKNKEPELVKALYDLKLYIISHIDNYIGY